MPQFDHYDKNKKRAMLLARRLGKLAIEAAKNDTVKGVINKEYKELIQRIKKA